MVVEISSSDAGMAILGGLLIGIASSLHLVLLGRVTGFSGIFYSLITYDKSSFFWKLSLISGVLFSSSILMVSAGTNKIAGTDSTIFDPAEVNYSGLSFIGYFIAGCLVGMGTKLGNGCTSGHGVCGLPRWSKRSQVAVITFCSTGIGIATLRYYTGFWTNFSGEEVLRDTNYEDNGVAIIFISSLIFLFICFIVRSNKNEVLDVVVSFFVGAIFSLGLGFGGMLKRRKILNFLTMFYSWDPQLLILLMTAVGFNVITFHLIINKKQKPYFSDKMQLPPPTKPVDFQLVMGAALFGIGWGIGGLCPGPAMALFTQFSLQNGIVWISGLAFGQIMVSKIEHIHENKVKVFEKILPEINLRQHHNHAKEPQESSKQQLAIQVQEISPESTESQKSQQHQNK